MSLGAAISDNPVLNRELDLRLNGRRGLVFIMTWLVLISLIFLLAYLILRGGQSSVLQGGAIGRQLFEWTLAAMLGLVLLLVPITTAGAIVNERERQTIAPLQLTMMGPFTIVASKLLASIAFIVLLVTLSLPLLASSIIIGGVEIGAVIKGVLLVVFTAVVVGAISIAASAIAHRVAAAIVMTLIAVMFMVLGSFLIMLALAVLDDVRGFDTVNPPLAPLVINPVAAVADITTPDDETAAGDAIEFGYEAPNPLNLARFGIVEVQQERARPMANAPVPFDAERTRIWRWYVVTMSAIAVLCIGVASERVRAPGRRER